MMRIGIIDYGLGNLASVAGAVERLGHESVVTASPEALACCDRLVLPGVGAFGDGIARLKALGLERGLGHLVHDLGRPILGICLGAQLLTRDSDEFGHHQGLGWVEARVRRLAPGEPGLRVPHVGWNDVAVPEGWRLFADVAPGSLFYFVHSYAITAEDDPGLITATCSHGQTFVAAFQKGRVYGTQFHPEKSQQQGLTVLRNFIEGA